MDSSCRKIIGYYVTEKKNAKMNWAEFENVCRKRDFTLLKINLKENLEDQGPFFAIFHKMTVVIVKSSLGDAEAKIALENFESYVKAHPEVIVVDPLDGVRSLMDRSQYYGIVQSSDLTRDKVFTPTFVNLTSTDLNENLQRLKDAGVTYPFVCKPLVSHGSDAHQMAVVFNEEGVADCRPPCVAQSFINHNAILYKIYIVGDHFNVSERPSLKNFSASDQKTIFFSTSDVSKVDSTSSLTVLDPEDAAAAPPSNPDLQRLQHIVSTLRKELGMILLGVDVVIEHGSGRYGIIDINIFPSYDGFPNFFDLLLDTIMISGSSKNLAAVEESNEASASSCLKNQESVTGSERYSLKSTQVCSRVDRSLGVIPNQLINQEYDQDDSGFDTSDSSDERKKKWCLERGRVGQSKKFSQQIKEGSASIHSSTNLLNSNSNGSYVQTGLNGV